MPKYSLLILFAWLQVSAFAQREFGVCDSTTYVLNADTTVIAGRTQLYLLANNTLSNLYDFSSSNPDEYIRDFDIVHPNLWYTVVGLRYIGGDTRLYKSTNKGQTWAIDTSHYAAGNAESLSPQFLPSINNLQHLNGDTLMLFMHYYESGILYSTDMGQTWTKWFSNLIAHYQGMFACDNQYYIFGYEGDGFRASMFGFDRSLLFYTDSTGMWNSFNNMGYHPPCYNGDTVNCIYPPFNASRCESYNFFKNWISENCSALTNNPIAESQLVLYPNPNMGKFYLSGTKGNEKFTLLNLLGQTIYAGNNINDQDFSALQSGMYLLVVANEEYSKTLEIMKH